MYLELLVKEAHRGDPGGDDSQEGGSNDGHGPLDGPQAQQQRLSDPAGTCAPTQSRQITHQASNTDARSVNEQGEANFLGFMR